MTEWRKSQFPLGADVRLEQLARDPYPILATLRRVEPVTWVPQVNMWFVTRRADIVSVLNDPKTFTVDHEESVIADMFGRHMMTIDGPEQVRQKRACMALFKPRNLEDVVRPKVRAIVLDLISSIDNSEVEVRSALTRPLAVRTVVEILGFSTRDADQIGIWYEAFAKALANFTRDEEVRANGKQAAREFGERALEVLRTNKTRHNLFGLLSDKEANFTKQEIVNNALIIMFGGIETTDGMMSNALWALLSHPDQMQQLRDNPRLMRSAIDETLRWEPSVQSCTRCTTNDVTVRGVSIPRGDIIQCMVGAANRDPETFENPDRFDVRRVNAREHLSFGAGRHFCLGAPLAYLETEILLTELLERFDTLGIDEQRSTKPLGYEFRKPEKLWLKLGQSATAD